MEVTAQMVKELRSQTGAGIMDCKEALRETDGDFEAAVRFLREKGLSSAAKKIGREASEGQVSARVDADGRVGVLVEVNCETDFVAKTEDFQSLVNQVAEHVSVGGPESLDPGNGGQPIQEAVTAAIAKLGENILVSRANRFEVQDGTEGRVVSYIHPGGRIGVLVEVECAPNGAAKSEEISDIGKDLAMQVAASNPSFLRRDLVPESSIESERVILRAQQAESGKPEKIIEKIVEGRLEKIFKESCLLEQLFIKDTDQSVQEMLSERAKKLGKEISVTRFVRFKLGERDGGGEGA